MPKPNKKTLRKKELHLYRKATIDDSGDDDSQKRLQISFASEYPVARRAKEFHVKLGAATKVGEPFLEVLSHDARHADLSELNVEGAPLLDEHDPEKQLGKVVRAEMSSDGKSRAVIEYDGASDLSNTRYKQAVKRSRPSYSVGYVTTKFLGDKAMADGRTAKMFAWAADEISSVALGADPSSKVARDASDDIEMSHCTKCGNEFSNDDLDDDFRCEDCGPVMRSFAPEDHVTRASGEKVSMVALTPIIEAAAMGDDRFHGKDNQGQATGWVGVRDIQQEGKYLSAIIYCSVDGKHYEVDLDFNEAGEVELGKHTEIQRKDKWEPVNGEGRSKPEVDSSEISDAEHRAKNLTQKNNMAETAVPDEKSIRSNERTIVTAEVEKTTRMAVVTEFETRNKKRDARNKEIHGLADEFCKRSGMNWHGKPGEVTVVADSIRKLEMEACNAPEDHSDSEVRTDFKTRCNEIIRESRAPKNQTNAAELEGSVASRCSLRRIYNDAMKAERSPCYMPKDGAEFEAHQEIHLRAKDFPGGEASLGNGLILPVNMPCARLGRNGLQAANRMTRDSLASDFPSAGAFVAPQFVFPYIELLRNMPALARAGMTVLSGVMGNLVLPRQEAATTAQSLAEGVALQEYDQVLGQIKMEPHRIGSNQKYSRLALLQSTPDFEAMVMYDHMAQIALWIDEMGLNGQGAADQPTGILNQLGINVVTFGGVASTAYAKCVAMETAIRKANIYEPVSFITTSVGRGTLRVTPATLTGSTVVSGATNAIWTDADNTDDGECIGRPAVDSQQVPNDIIVALVGRHLVMAQWGGLAVVLDTISQADQDKYKLSINTYVDFALRHAQAVTRSADGIATLS